MKQKHYYLIKNKSIKYLNNTHQKIIKHINKYFQYVIYQRLIKLF